MANREYRNTRTWEWLSIIYDNYIEGALETLTPTMVTDYPVINLDERDPNELAIISGLGTSVTPKAMKFAMGNVGTPVAKLVQGVAICKHNLELSGGVTLRMGLTDGDSGTWDHVIPLFHDSDNICPNGGCEQFTDYVPTPAGADELVVNWVSFKNTTARPVSSLAITPINPAVAAVNHVHDSSNRSLSETSAHLTWTTTDNDYASCFAQHMEHRGNELRVRVRFDYYIPSATKLNGNLTAYIFGFKSVAEELPSSFGTALSAAMGGGATPYNSTVLSQTEDTWLTYDVTMDLTDSADESFLALAIIPQGGLSSGGFEMYVDNVQFQVMSQSTETLQMYETDDRAFTEAKNSDYISFIFPEPIPIKYARFEFVSKGVNSSTSETNVELGRIFLGPVRHVGVQDTFDFNSDDGSSIDRTLGGSPINDYSQVPNTRMNFRGRVLRKGEMDALEDAIKTNHNKQVFVTFLNQSAPGRAAVGHFASKHARGETALPGIADFNFDFVEEG